MRPEEFWDMTPYEWERKCAGFQRQQNLQGFYHRETWKYILHAGGYRDENDEPIKGEDLLRLPGEKKTRRKAPQPLNPLLKMTEAERADLRDRINRSAPQPDVLDDASLTP